MGVWGLPQLWRPYFGCFARWTPDLTANSPQSQCVTSGTVAGGVEFHLVVNYGSVQGQGAVINVTCNYIDVLEQTDVHEPQHFRVDNPQGTTYTPDQISTVCSSPPTGYQNYIVFSTPPFWGFSCHNTSYLVKASYSYTKVTGPPPTYQRIGPIEVSITVNFNNLTVEAEPEYLINNPGGDNHNTTITFQLQSAQKKLCSATISIYTSTQQLVKQETLNNLLCPGSYTYTWDGKSNQLPALNRVFPAGIYLYDISVQGVSPYDTDTRCSLYLKVKGTKLDILSCDEQTTSLQVSYVLEDPSGRAAKSTKIKCFHPEMEFVTEVSGGTVTNPPNRADPAWNVTCVDIPTGDKWGGWLSLICPIDNHAEQYKNHTPKPAIPKNSHLPSLHAGVVIDAGHGGQDTGTIGTTYGTQEKTVNLPRALELEEVLINHSSYEYAHTNPSQRLIVYWVELTRREDVFLTLTERAEIARKFKEGCEKQIQDLQKKGIGIKWLGFAFVSIHHNSPGDNRRTEILRRDDIGGSNILSSKIKNQVQQIQTLQTREYKEDKRTARMDLILHLREKNRWDKAAVIVEIAFLTSPYDEALATGRGEGIDKDFPQKFINRLHRGIDDYFVPNPIPGYGPGL